MPRDVMTKKQAADQTYEYILSFFKRHGRSPSQRHLMEALGLTHHQVTHRIAWLQGEGRIHDFSTTPVITLDDDHRVSPSSANQ